MGRLFGKKLTEKEVDGLVAAKLSWILSNADPVRVILVGSAARYEMTDRSDIDIIVVFESSDQKERGQTLLFKSRPRDDWPHDLILSTEAEFEAGVSKGGGLFWLAKKDGKVLFQKGALVNVES